MDPLLPREALVERLVRADARAIVSAPPGFGKTTLLEAWAVHRKAMVVSLAGVGPREAAAVALEIAEAGLSRPAKPFRTPRIAFDDVAHDVVARVVSAVPTNVGLVVATRAGVSERAAFRDVIEPRALAFRGEELARAVGAVRAREIMARTGGWPLLVGAMLAGRSLTDAVRMALAGMSPELQRAAGRLAAIGTVRRAFLQFVAPQAIGALDELGRRQLASVPSEGDGGVVQIFGDVLTAGRRLLAECFAAEEPKAHRDMQRRIGELFAAGTRPQPAELIDRFARAEDGARVAELLVRHGPALELELAREHGSRTLVAWADVALRSGQAEQKGQAGQAAVHVLRALGAARAGVGVGGGGAADGVGAGPGAAGAARVLSEGERAALGWRWRARWAEAEAFAAWGRGEVDAALEHLGRARVELVGVRVDEPEADALEARWRVLEARCVRARGPWERAREVLGAALAATAEPRGMEARVLRSLMAASAMGEGDALTLARVAEGGDPIGKLAGTWLELLRTGDVGAALARLEASPFEPWLHTLAQLARRRLGAAIESEVAPEVPEDARGDLLRELASVPWSAGGMPRVGRWDAVADAVRRLVDGRPETLEAITRAASAGGFAVPWGLAPVGVVERVEARQRERIGDAAWVATTRAGVGPLDAAGYAAYAQGDGKEAVVVVVPEDRIFVAGRRLDVGQKRVLVPLLTALLLQADAPLSLRDLAVAVWRVRSPRLKPSVQTKVKVAVSRLRTLLGREHEVVVTTKKAEGGADVAAYQIAPGISFAVVTARG